MLWISNRDVALMSPESRNVSLKSELRRLSRRRRKSGHWLNPRHMTYERHVVNEHLDDRFRLVVSFQSGFLGGWGGGGKNWFCLFIYFVAFCALWQLAELALGTLCDDGSAELQSHFREICPSSQVTTIVNRLHLRMAKKQQVGSGNKADMLRNKPVR